MLPVTDKQNALVLLRDARRIPETSAQDNHTHDDGGVTIASASKTPSLLPIRDTNHPTHLPTDLPTGRSIDRWTSQPDVFKRHEALHRKLQNLVHARSTPNDRGHGRVRSRLQSYTDPTFRLVNVQLGVLGLSQPPPLDNAAPRHRAPTLIARTRYDSRRIDEHAKRSPLRIIPH